MIGKSWFKGFVGVVLSILIVLALFPRGEASGIKGAYIQTVYFDPWTPPLDVASPIECRNHPGTCGYACFYLTANPSAFSCRAMFFNFTKDEPNLPSPSGLINYKLMGPGSPELTLVHPAGCAAESEVCGIVCFAPTDNSALSCHEVIFEQ